MTSSVRMTSREHLNRPTSFEDEEKGKSFVTVQEISSADDKLDKEEDFQWRTGFRERFPWVGFGALFMMLVSIALTAIVLKTSEDKARHEWPSYERLKWIKGSWREKAQIDPHVVLAIINTVTNVSLAIAIGNGIAIAWWRRAMKGSTVEDLHRSWTFSSSVLELLCAGKKFNLIALCALTAKLALLDNVLLQKAAGTQPGFFPDEAVLTWLPMARQLPADYAGAPSPDGSVGATSAAFSWDLTGYIRGENILPNQIYTTGFDTHCDGICYPYFEGFGFEFDCTAKEVSAPYPITPDLAFQNTRSVINAKLEAYYNLTSSQSNSANGTALTDATYDAIYQTPLQQNPLLHVEVQFIPQGDPQDEHFISDLPKIAQGKTYDRAAIGMLIRHSELTPSNTSDSSIGSGKTWTRYCALLPAVIEYPLVITNIDQENEGQDVKSLSSAENGITLTSHADYTSANEEGFSGNQFNGLRVMRPAYTPYDKDYDSNLKKIAIFLETNFGAFVLLEYLKADGKKPGIYSPNALSNQYSEVSPSLFGQWWPTYDPSPSCNISIIDPLGEIGNGLNNLMVRSSMRAATHTVSVDDDWGYPIMSFNQSSKSDMYVTTVFFTTNWPFGWAAMSVIFFCVLCVLPTYWGFWELGRNVTLAPMEVSAALQAPILEHPVVATSGDVRQLVKEIGDRRIQYGAVDGHLGVAGASHVRQIRE